jgi:hypothetical protein
MNKIHALLIFIGFINFACRSDNRETETKQEAVSLDAGAFSGVKILPFQVSLQMSDAILELYTPFDNQVFKPGKVPFEFNIKNFPYQNRSVQKPKLLMILNGEDPMGLNSTVFQRELGKGTYRLVAFLVNENGLALKDFGNYVARDFHVGDVGVFPYSAEPYLAVNFPREGQVLNSSDELVVDYLVIGGDMDLDGLKLSLSIGDNLIHEISEMKPIRLANLPKGTHQISFILKRNNGKELEGPFSMVSKSVIVR